MLAPQAMCSVKPLCTSIQLVTSEQSRLSAHPQTTPWSVFWGRERFLLWHKCEVSSMEIMWHLAPRRWSYFRRWCIFETMEPALRKWIMRCSSYVCFQVPSLLSASYLPHECSLSHASPAMTSFLIISPEAADSSQWCKFNILYSHSEERTDVYRCPLTSTCIPHHMHTG